MRKAALAALFCFAAAPAFAGGDSLAELQRDPSAEAGAKLDKLFRKTENGDQRFWLIRALGYRVKEHADSGSLETLMFAVENKDPAVRGPALKALSSFGALPEEQVRSAWLARLDAVAKREAVHSSPVVREGAADLLRAINLWRNPAQRITPAPPRKPGIGGRYGMAIVLGLARFFSLLGVPSLILIWVALRLPVFDPETAEGRFSIAAWDVVKEQQLFVAAAGISWVYLCMMLVGYGYDGWVRFIADAGITSVGPWVAAYFASWFCVFGPGAMMAAGLARRPEGSAAAASLTVFPQVIALSCLIAGALAPMELAYRMFFRRARSTEPRGLLGWLLETGTLRGAYLVSAVMAKEEHGLIPALERAQALSEKVFPVQGLRLGLSAFDVRFSLLAGTPVFVLFCGLLAKTFSVRLGISWLFVFFGCGVWSAGVMAVLLFAIVQILEGVAAAGRYHAAVSERIPRALSALEEFIGKQEAGQEDAS